MRLLPSHARGKRCTEERSFIQVRLLLLVSILSLSALGLLAAPIPTNKPTTYPAWWFSRGVITPLNATNSAPSWPSSYPTSDDYAVINEGQLKNFATQAYSELYAKAPSWVWSSTPGQALATMVQGWSPTASGEDDYKAINLGQLKTVAKPFYDVLIAIGYPVYYPWTGTGADDYAAANIGQLKNIFSFDVGYDGDGNGLPDWWEMEYFGHLGNVASSIPNGNGQTLLYDYQHGNDPSNYYSLGGQTITPTIAMLSGNNQSGAAGAFLSNPLVIKVMDGSGHPLSDAPVTFYATGGGLSLSSTGATGLGTVLSTTTNSSGQVSVYFQQPNRASFTSTISATAASSQISFTVRTTADTNPPASPSNGSATPGTAAGEIDLTWVNNADNATYIKIQQSTDGTTWTDVATLTDTTTTFYAVTGLTVGQPYYFRIAAGN